VPLSFNPAVNIAQLQDWSNSGTSQTAGQLYNIGSNLYYVVRRQIPTGTADGFWCVFKSTDGVTWALDAAVTGGAVTFGLSGALSCNVGTKIYMLSNDPGAGPAHTLQIFTYDTGAPGAISGPSANSPTSNRLGFNTQATVTPLNSGSLLVCCTDVSNGAGNDLFECIRYAPGSNTWDAAFVNINTRVDATGSQAVAAVHDSVTDQTYVLYILDNSVSPKAVQCVTLSNVPAVVNTTATIFTTTRPFIETWGVPTISADAPSGNRSVVFPFKTGGAPTAALSAAYVDIATFATATEAVDDSTDLPATWLVTPYSQLTISGWAALDVGGVLYMVFAADNGNNNNATSLSALYAKARVGGVWGGLQLLFSSALSREMSQPYPSTFGGKPAIAFNLFDPTLGVNNLAALSSFILLGGAAPGPVFQANQILNAAACGLIALPFVLSCCSICEMEPPMYLNKVIIYGRDELTA
jgi:hypothetical protein